jgi:hypothetical protein
MAISPQALALVNDLDASHIERATKAKSIG